MRLLPLTKEEFEAFVKEGLDLQRLFYDKGDAPRWSEAYVMARHDPDWKPFKRDDGSHEEIGRIVMAMPDLTEDHVRSAVKRGCFLTSALAVCVKMEVFYTTVATDADPAIVAEVEQAKIEKTIHKLEGRGEAVFVYIESEDFPIRLFTAEITYYPPLTTEEIQKGGEDFPGHKKILGAWEEQKLQLPYPEFKRYLPSPDRRNQLMNMPPEMKAAMDEILNDQSLRDLFEAGDLVTLQSRLRERMIELLGEPPEEK